MKPRSHKFTRKPYAWVVDVKDIGIVPVFHNTHFKDQRYMHVSDTNRHFAAQMEALEQSKMVVFQRDKSKTDYTCVGYVGGDSSTANRAYVFTVDNIQIDRDTLTVSFDVVDKV